MKNETKSERIFNQTRRECKHYIDTWGYKENVGFNRLSYEDNEMVSTRTFNEIQTEIDKANKYLITDLELGIIDENESIKLKQIYSMIQITLNNSIQSYNI